MARDLKRGDRVGWRSGGGRARGTVERVITKRAKVAGRSVAATPDDPRYLLTDERTGKSIVRRGPTLRKLAPAKAKAAAAPARRPRPRLPRGRWIALGAGILLVAALAAAYLTQGPKRLADDYQEAAAPAFERVDESMYDAFESFRARFFRGLAIEDLAKKRTQQNLGRLRRAFKRQYRSDRETVAATNEAIAAAEEAIAEAEADLTEVDSLPLLGGRGELGGAEDDAELAGAYLESSRSFLAQLGELAAYSKKTVALEEEITNIVLSDAPEPEAPVEVFRAALDEIVGDLERTERMLKRLPKAPVAARAFEYATAAGLRLALDYFGTIQDAFENLDPGLIDTANEELDDKLDGFGRAVLTRFFALQSDSDLSEKLDDVEGNEQELAERLGVDEGPESVAPPLLPPDPDREDKKAA